MRVALLLIPMLMAGLLFAACGDDGDTPPVETPADSADGGADQMGDDTADEADDAGDDDFTLPESELAAPLDQTYDTSGAAVTDDALPVPSGSVIARRYQAGGLYVVYYDGLDIAVTGPLCPGNSIGTATGFEFVSNAPTGEGACSTATTLVPAPTGVRLCGDDVLYLTAIPVETEGTLFGTIERFREDSSIIGLTSQTVADSAAAPEVDLSSCDIPAG